ncbi:inositol-trisphosphate 3-kinase homolog isoform X2 [Planococcus citri]|uniref:inositol-trisphosphate 3-kinase homolog isoform X2 n=1 Tax=Planococcus citri TaxID=170843 RepID=UPI0031FA2299
MASENNGYVFPPITYSTAYNLRDEIREYLKERGILLSEEDGRVIIEKQPAESICRNNTYSSNSVKKSRRKNDHSFLEFLALNALGLAAPASDVLLRRQHSSSAVAKESEPISNTTTSTKISNQSWFQLSGHPDCFAPAGPGTIWKKCSGGTERNVYEALSQEPALKDIVPRYLREVEYAGETFIELQDLLHGFRDPHVMDIKMGTRTFLESEVQNTFAREDLYLKMIAVDPNAPTAEEHTSRAVTKLRYMQFREEQSSTSTLGFRIEAMKFRGSKPVTDLKKVKSSPEVSDTLSLFLSNREDIRQRLVTRLTEIRTTLEQSQYFRTHEVVGSSILIIYDDVKVGAWLIDFAKTRPVPSDKILTHRLPWSPGNHEEGFLYGLDMLINKMENIKIPLNVKTEASTPSVLLTS